MKRIIRHKIVPATIGAIVILMLLAVPAQAVEKRGDRLLEGKYSMAGLRLGVWSNQGDEPDEQNLKVDLNNTGFYTEFYFDYRLTPMLLGEFSAGIASRGDAVIDINQSQFVGPILLYPVLFQLKISPLSGVTRSFHPYILGGGGFVFGKQNLEVIIGTVNYSDFYDAQETKIDFVPVVGGGIDWAVADQVGLNFSVKYQQVKFSDYLAAIRDYSGISFAVGAAYYIHKK